MTHARAIQLLVLGLLVFAVFAVINSRRSTALSRQRQCEVQQRDIEGAKEQFALEHEGQAPADWSALIPRYLPRPPPCPSGGTYRLGDLQEPVSCSLPDHAFLW